MLRSLTLAARDSAPAFPRSAATRLFAASASEAAAPNPPKARGNSEYVKRRQSYRHELHKQRIAFGKDGASKGDDVTEKKDQGQAVAMREARAERKRVRSEGRQAQAKAAVAEMQRAAAERQKYRKGDWERKQKEVGARRAADLEMLLAHAGEWVTEETLDAHVERAVDDFFIQVREEEEGPKVVRW